MEDEEEVEEETTSASEESSEDEEEIPEKPATGLEPMGTGLVPISIKTKEPFVEVEEAEYLPPVTSLDTSDEFLPDISDPGKYIAKIYVKIIWDISVEVSIDKIKESDVYFDQWISLVK